MWNKAEKTKIKTEYDKPEDLVRDMAKRLKRIETKLHSIGEHLGVSMHEQVEERDERV